nr:hypothetical protein [Actinomycetota bacterium]
LSGTVVETLRLGLPSLPGADRGASLNWQSLVTGTHTAQVWLDGPRKQRLALLGQLAESDVIHNGADLWTYSSADGAVTHSTSAPTATKPSGVADAVPHGKDVASYTPLGAAQAALKAIDPTTVVTVDRTARVAGQPAYTLVLTPRDSRSTVHRVLIAIDAAHNLPLRVQVFGAGKDAVFEIGFATLSYKKPAARVFSFTAPRGSTVSGSPLDALAGKSNGDRPSAAPPGAPSAPPKSKTAGAPKVIGTGWTSILELPAGSSPLAGGPTGPMSGKGGAAGDLFSRLTTTLPDGAKLLHTALVNAVVTPDGRVFVGAVDPAMLEQVAAGTKG